jgi:hypothetical protein
MKQFRNRKAARKKKRKVSETKVIEIKKFQFEMAVSKTPVFETNKRASNLSHKGTFLRQVNVSEITLIL